MHDLAALEQFTPRLPGGSESDLAMSALIFGLLILKARDKLLRHLAELDRLPESRSGAGQGSWS